MKERKKEKALSGTVAERAPVRCAGGASLERRRLVRQRRTL